MKRNVQFSQHITLSKVKSRSGNLNKPINPSEIEILIKSPPNKRFPRTDWFIPEINQNSKIYKELKRSRYQENKELKRSMYLNRKFSKEDIQMDEKHFECILYP